MNESIPLAVIDGLEKELAEKDTLIDSLATTLRGVVDYNREIANLISKLDNQLDLDIYVN